MLRSRRIRSLLPRGAMLAVAIAATACAPSPVRHSPPAKLDDPLFRDLRRADALGLTPTATLSLLPVSKSDLAKALEQSKGPRKPPGVAAQEYEAPEPGSDEEWMLGVFHRNEAAVADAMDTTGFQSSFFAPIDDARLRLVYVDTPAHFYNEQGREFNQGLNLYASDRVTARLFDHVAIAAEPEFRFLAQDRPKMDGSETEFNVQELSASARFWVLEAAVGRMSLWWGPARHGTLLLSTNAQALDMVKVGTAGPILLPGLLGHLGLIRAEVFVSKLEDSRIVGHPFFAGARATTRILPWLELGAARTAMFGGQNRPVTGRTIWDIILARGENEPGDAGDQLAMIDARIILPLPWQPLELYGEYGGEDEAGSFFSRTAEVAGVYLPRVGPWHFLEFTLEYANTAVPGHPGVWYTNGNYPDGYTYKGHIMGHHVGTDGLDIFAELKLHPFTDESFVFVSYDYEEHNRLVGTEERLHQFRIGFEHRAWRKLWVSAFFEQDYWYNYEQEPGRNTTGNAVSAAVLWRF